MTRLRADRFRSMRFGVAGPAPRAGGFRSIPFGVAGPALQGAVLALGLLASAPAHGQDLPSGPVSLANGRITLGTDISFSTTAQDDHEGAWFNYTDYEHNTLRMTRLGVTADIRLLDRVAVLADVRTENGDAVRPYALFLRVRPLEALPIDIQAGRIPPTFGAFSRRSYADGNPLVGYPLAYQYLTSLRADAIPVDADELLRMRARGWRPSYRLGSQEIGTGMPLITAFRWDTGVQVRIGSDRLMMSAAVTNGTLSDPRTRDNNSGKQLSGRLQWRPTAGLAFGASGARGRYLSDAVWMSTSLEGSDRSAQRALGIDAEYSRDHWLVRGEAVWENWQVPTLAAPLSASSAFVEGTYKILPGFFAAARVDRLSFDRVTTPTQTHAWDAPITRAETGVGFYVRRNFLAKTTYQHNWRAGGLVRSRGLLAVQLQFWL